MNKTLLILSGLLFLTFGRSFAQADSLFAPDGAQWWYNTDGYGSYYNYYDDMEYDTVMGDTTIMGQPCRIIKSTTIRKWVSLVDTVHPVSIYPIDSSRLFLRNTSDTVFIYNQNFHRFTPLYVFNVHEGDTVCLPVIGSDLRPNPYDHGDTTFCFIIDSIRMTRFDTTYLETFYEHSLTEPLQGGVPPLSPLYNWWGITTDNNVPAGAYARKIGGLWLGLLPIHIETNIINKPTEDTNTFNPLFLYLSLRCYEDSSVSIHIDTSALNGCFYDLTYDTPSAIVHVRPMTELLTVYPNPAHEVIHVRAQSRLVSAGTLLLTDVSGRLLRQIPWRKGQREATVPVSGLAKGFYFLKFRQGQSEYVQKLIISSR